MQVQYVNLKGPVTTRFIAFSVWQEKKKESMDQLFKAFVSSTQGESGKWKHFYYIGTCAERQDNEVTRLLACPKKWDIVETGAH